MEQVDIVRAVVYNEGNVLVLRNAVENHEEPYAGRWELPGGKIEHEEDHEEAVHREIEEETGLSCRLVEDLERIDVIEDGVRAACWFYLMEAPSREVTLSDEHMEHRWIEPDAYQDMDWYYESGFPIPVLERVKGDIRG